MIPQTERRKPRNSSKVNLFISAAFHGVIVLTLVYFAARQGLLGKQLKKIAIEMVKEKRPEKPKEPEKPKTEQIKTEAPKVAAAPKMETVKAPPETPPPAAGAAPPSVAPAIVELPSFTFGGGKPVETASDPVLLYKGMIESVLRSRWDRPADMEDAAFTAEVEVGVGRQGEISEPAWKKSSGDKRWDESVRQAIARTRSVGRSAPKNFPPRVLVRFDVLATEPLAP
jgi:hypothetical protein